MHYVTPYSLPTIYARLINQTACCHGTRLIDLLDVASIRYSLYEKASHWCKCEKKVHGHSDIVLDVKEVIKPFEMNGRTYNFVFSFDSIISVSPFKNDRATYKAVFEITPKWGDVFTFITEIRCRT